MGNTAAASERSRSSSGDDDSSVHSPFHLKAHRHHHHHHHHVSFSGNHQHLPVVGDLPSGRPKAVPTVFRWTGGGKSVALAGSFDNWKEKIPMAKSHEDFATVVELAVGTHEYKYLVDGSWTFNPAEPNVSNEFGSCNNQVTVKESDFEVFEALATDGADLGIVDINAGDFTQDIPTRASEGGLHHRPPALPPQLLQVILNKDDVELEPSMLPEPDHVALNHLYALSIKDGVMTLSSTLRYKKKYVTTLLYRPA